MTERRGLLYRYSRHIMLGLVTAIGRLEQFLRRICQLLDGKTPVDLDWQG
jgi:hypothetical protein